MIDDRLGYVLRTAAVGFSVLLIPSYKNTENFALKHLLAPSHHPITCAAVPPSCYGTCYSKVDVPVDLSVALLTKCP